MQLTCPPAPTNKKEYISGIGKILVEENGKKKYYKPEEIIMPIEKVNGTITSIFPDCVKMTNLLYGQIVNLLIIKALTIYQSDHLTIFTQSVSCWAMCTFSSHSDFDQYHLQKGEICNYVEMKTEMLSGLSVAASADWTAIPDLDIDSSWLDFGDVFGSMLEGIGDFISGIFDSI